MSHFQAALCYKGAPNPVLGPGVIIPFLFVNLMVGEKCINLLLNHELNQRLKPTHSCTPSEPA